MKNFFKKLLHKHCMVKIDWCFVETEHTVYSKRLYRCDECGKEIWVDGRFDPYV